MASHDDPERWHRYFEATRDRPPHALFDLLDEHLPADGDAIDLGCGAGRGTLRLLERGLRVTATDVSQEAIDIVRERVPAGASVRLVRSPFETLELPEVDVAVACYTLFFMPPDEHARFWSRLVEAIRPGGLFAGEFLGVRDEWADRGYAVHTREQVDELLRPFDVLHLAEEEEDSTTSLEEPKHWHVFHAIARKR